MEKKQPVMDVTNSSQFPDAMGTPIRPNEAVPEEPLVGQQETGDPAEPSAQAPRQSCWIQPGQSGWGRCLCYGLLITASQIVFACAHSGRLNPAEAYLQLYQFDSLWYGNIAEAGYHSEVPPGFKDGARNNVAFFPAYPLLVQAIALGFGLEIRWAAMIAAQLACWGFWTYLLLFFQRWRISRTVTCTGVVMILVHPAAFFLVAGFSESLFLIALLGFLYWSEKRGFGFWLLAAGHGFLMTATRIVGLPLAVAPLLGMMASPGNSLTLVKENKRAIWLALLAVLASLGAILFFVFCYKQFGQWDLYLQTQRNRFGVEADYCAIFKAKNYYLIFRKGGEDLMDPDALSRLWVSLMMALFGMLAFREVFIARSSRTRSWQQRLSYYWCAWFLLYIPVSGVANSGMASMIRYSLPVHILLVMSGVHLISRRPLQGFLKDLAWVLLAWAAFNSLCLQSWLVYRFTHGRWVA